MTSRRSLPNIGTVTPDERPQETLELKETAIWRFEDGEEVLNIAPIRRAIEFLTEGRDKSQPELSILAFDVLQAIITGHRVELFKDAFQRTRIAPRTMARRHLHVAAGRSVLTDAGPAPAVVDAAAAEWLRLSLRNEDARFKDLVDAELIDAIRAARAGNTSSLSTICARLSLACGAFDDAQKPGEEFADALDRVRLAYANAGPRPKTNPLRKRKMKRKSR